jgi:hypothetical protein
MSLLIGNFSPEQYQAYMNPAPAFKAREGRLFSDRLMAFLNVFCYSALALFISRLAYSVLHRFAYSNNHYLFEKFKSHNFQTIDKPEDYATVQLIYERFKGCAELNQQELQQVQQQLTSVKKRFEPTQKTDLGEDRGKKVVVEDAGEPQQEIVEEEEKEEDLHMSVHGLFDNLDFEVPPGQIEEKSKEMSSSADLLDELFAWKKEQEESRRKEESPMVSIKNSDDFFPSDDETSTGSSDKQSIEDTTLSESDHDLDSLEEQEWEKLSGDSLEASDEEGEPQEDQSPADFFTSTWTTLCQTASTAALESGSGIKNAIQAQVSALKEVCQNATENRQITHLVQAYHKIVGAVTDTVADKIGLVAQSTEERFIKWKIERYEELLHKTKKIVLDYMLTIDISIREVHQLIEYLKDEDTPQALKQLLPIVELCQEPVNIQENRFTQEYLQQVREAYDNRFLDHLRVAATWAKEHRSMPDVEHIDAICYRFYTMINLNECCLKIMRAFMNFGVEALKEQSVDNHLPDDPRYNLIRELHTIYLLIKMTSQRAKAPVLHLALNSLMGHLNGFLGFASFDPNRQSNPIHVFFEKFITTRSCPVPHAVKDIAMGSPTIEKGTGKAEINPEFLGFLRECAKRKHRHLYINNQNAIPKSAVAGDESVRCQALHDCAENQFKGTLYVVTQSQNSWFYEQKGPSFTNRERAAAGVGQKLKEQLLQGTSKEFRYYVPDSLRQNNDFKIWINDHIDLLLDKEGKNINLQGEFVSKEARDAFIQNVHKDLQEHPCFGKELGYSVYQPSAQSFKEELVDQMFTRPTKETGNYIAKDLVKHLDLIAWSKNMIDETHKIMFGGRETLTLEERRIFIRLFYRNLNQKVLIETKANSENKSCKDRIDRGAATEAEDFAYTAILNGCMNDPRVIEFFQMFLFTRAIIVRKRAIIEERLERTIETTKFMLDHQDELKQLQKALFPGIGVTLSVFPQKDQDLSGSVLGGSFVWVS